GGARIPSAVLLVDPPDALGGGHPAGVRHPVRLVGVSGGISSGLWNPRREPLAVSPGGGPDRAADERRGGAGAADPLQWRGLFPVVPLRRLATAHAAMQPARSLGDVLPAPLGNRSGTASPEGTVVVEALPALREP